MRNVFRVLLPIVVWGLVRNKCRLKLKQFLSLVEILLRCESSCWREMNWTCRCRIHSYVVLWYFSFMLIRSWFLWKRICKWCMDELVLISFSHFVWQCLHRLQLLSENRSFLFFGWCFLFWMLVILDEVFLAIITLSFLPSEFAANIPLLFSFFENAGIL